MSSIYLHKPAEFMNRIILNKRKEMLDIINKFYEKDELYDALDIENKERKEQYLSTGMKLSKTIYFR